MAFGAIYYRKDATATGWVQGKLYAKMSDGNWQPAVHIYECTARVGSVSTWTERFSADITPPAAPPLFVNAYDAAARTMTTTFTAPADVDVAKMCCKISKTAYPTTPGVSDANSPTTVQADGTPFWLWNTTASGKSTRKHTGFVNSQKYYMSAWAMDASGNWSAPVNYTWTFAAAPAPVKTLTTKTAYVTTTDSASYRSAYGWRTDNDDVYQGGDQNLQGFWFYGTKIAALLAKAESITKIQIYVQRQSSAHGVSGAGNIYIGHHGLTTQPTGAPASNAVTGEANYIDLARGAAGWATLPASWGAYFKSGAYRGLGMQYGVSSTTSSYYNICYGYGTSSGKLLFTWTEYV